MITGIKLPIAPNMKGKTIENVLYDLDILSERLPESSFINSRDITIVKRTYIGRKYITQIISYDKKDDTSFNITYDLYRYIYEALPEFLFCYKLSEKTIIISFPNFGNSYFGINEMYENLMNEIQRLAVFLMKLYGDNPDVLKSMLRDYVDLCIDYPKL